VNIPLAAGTISTGHLVATGLMLVWYLRYRPTRRRVRQPRLGSVRTLINPRSTLTEQELAA
jgi:hypothetical protein